jgi:hypothetical protein
MKMPNFIRSPYRLLAIVRLLSFACYRSLGAPLAPARGQPQGLPRHLTTLPIAGTIAETGNARMRLIS